MGNLSRAGYSLALVLGLFWVSVVEAATEAGACRESQVQPGDIDLDQPRDQLARQSDLIIPPGATVGKVQVHDRPIFDTDKPGQDNALYRLMNWLNVPTWDSALVSQLVFSEGDSFDPEDLAESERILRSRQYLTAAWISPVRVCGDEVDVAVLTRDTWTLFPSLGVSRSGGENTATVGFQIPIFSAPARACPSPGRGMRIAAPPASRSMIRTFWDRAGKRPWGMRTAVTVGAETWPSSVPSTANRHCGRSGFRGGGSP